MPFNLPSRGITEIRFEPEVSVAITESPFSFVQQVYDFGGQRWSAVITLAEMSKRVCAEWRAFFLKLNGPYNTFYLAPTLDLIPRGAATGTPLVDAGNTAHSSSVLTKGWTPETAGVLLAGDWLSINDRLYCVTDDVDSDSTGDATIPIWPYLTATPPSEDDSIDLRESCRGIFRLVEMPGWTWGRRHVVEEEKIRCFESL